MLDDVENYCIENVIPVIELKPTNNKLMIYYEQFGFNAVRSDYNYLNIIMAKPVQQLLLQTPINYKSGKTRKARRIKKQLTENDKNIINFLVEKGPQLSKNMKAIRTILKIDN